MNKTATIAFFLISFAAFNQKDSLGKTPFFSIGHTEIGVGLNAGIFPNFSDKRGKLNHFLEFSTSFRVKNLPLTLNTRISDEKYISGRPSYFRLSYDAAARYRVRRGDLEGEIGDLNTQIGGINSEIYAMEGKIAFLDVLLENYKNQQVKWKIPEGNISYDSLALPKTNFPKIPEGINSSFKIPNKQKPEFNWDQYKLDSINALKQDYTSKMNLSAYQLDSLKDLKNMKLKELDGLKMKKPLHFLDGIKRFDLGMTTLPGGKMSNNSIPVQGVRVKGTYRKYFYDLAAGLTVPNRIFSNSISDQVLNNTQNIFNMNQFFTVNSARFVSSAIVGYGNEEKNSISIENFYNGRELKQILNKKKQVTNYTNNISFTLSPLKSGRLFLEGSTGQTIPFGDSVKRNYVSQLSYTAKAKYRFSRPNILLFAQVKRIGTNYDGFSQGIYNSGFFHHEYGFQSKFFKHLGITGRYTNDRFTSDSQGSGLVTNALHVDVQETKIHNLFLFAGFSLVNARGNDSISHGNNTLYRGGFVFRTKLKRIGYLLSGNGTYSNLNRLDSTVQIITSSLRTEFQHRYLQYGLIAEYQKYEGFNTLFGSNILISPTFGAKYKGITFSSRWTYLHSQQFSDQFGCDFTLSASPSRYITWYITAKKWLPNDLVLLVPLETDFPVRPWFWEFRMKIHLNVRK